jgi:elongation factor Ts
MAEITAALVKELRDETNLGMMDCKKALQQTGGDKAKAVQLLREQGLSVATKKAARETKDGLVAASLSADGRTGALIEVACETDFVARNEIFQGFVAELAGKALATGDGELAPAMQAATVAKVAEIGENIVIRRNTRYQAQGPGRVAKYIHLGGKVGVLLEVGCGKDATAASPAFQELAKDITLHIAAAAPQCVRRDQVDPTLVRQEQAIFAKQAEGKPAQVIEKIVAGKLEKFYAGICLLEQGFVKDPDISVRDLLARVGKDLGDTIEVRRFTRYQLGEAV